MNLVIKYPNLPLRAYEKDQLEKQIDALQGWLTNLLGLTGVESAKRLVIATEALKEQCIGMGFQEIKKMFEMYADNKLNIEPRTNYFDRILLGKIVKEYRKTKNQIPKKVNLDEEKAEKDILYIIHIFDYYIEKNKLIDDWEWVYIYLESKGIHKFDKDQKKKKFNHYSKKEIQGEKLKEETVIKLSRISLLKDYFDNLIHQNKHIKDLI